MIYIGSLRLNQLIYVSYEIVFITCYSSLPQTCTAQAKRADLARQIQLAKALEHQHQPGSRVQ